MKRSGPPEMTPRLFLPLGEAAGPGDVLTLPPPQRHYLLHVLRRRPGDRVVLLDGQREAAAALLPDGRLAVEALGPAAGPPGMRVTLLMALLKGEKMDWVVEKATELGAARIVPVACARSVRRLDEGRAGRQRARWQRIATAAAQQSRRPDVPEIAPVADLAVALPEVEAPLRLLPWEGAAGAPLRAALPAASPSAAAVLVG